MAYMLLWHGKNFWAQINSYELLDFWMSQMDNKGVGQFMSPWNVAIWIKPKKALQLAI